MEKRGSHVGVILSFVIFVTSLIFLYSILAPAIQVQNDKENLLADVRTGLTEKFSEEIAVIIIQVNESVAGNCFEIENFIGRNITSHIVDASLVVKSLEEETPLYSRINGNNLQINRTPSDVFFRIYDSEVFDDVIAGDIGGCVSVGNDEYSVGSITINKQIFNSKINETAEEYKNDYSNLKKELGISSLGEFGFEFSDKDGGKIETGYKNASTSVYVDESSIFYLNKEANINKGTLNIRVW